MKVRIIKGVAGAYGLAYPVGAVVDLPEAQAKELIQSKFAELESAEKAVKNQDSEAENTIKKIETGAENTENQASKTAENTAKKGKNQ